MTTTIRDLTAHLRLLIDPQRESLEIWVRDRLKSQIQRFLEIRQPNRLLREVYPDGQFPLGVKEATNVEDRDAETYREYKRAKDRPAFEVSFRPDADATLARLAKNYVENLVVMFTSRALAKLGPIVERAGDYSVETGNARFHSGGWEGEMSFVFSSGLEFTTRLKLITNFTKYGNPYGQYPCTFHEVAIPNNNIFAGSAPVEALWAHVGYVPPVPIERAKWSKIVTGSILMVDGEVIHIISPKQAKGLVDPIQIGRIETWNYSARLERLDKTIESYNFSPDERSRFETLEHEYKFTKSAQARRETAFEAFRPQLQVEAMVALARQGVDE